MVTSKTVSREPAALRRGKAFHRRVQADWQNTAEGNVQPEHTIELLGMAVRRGEHRKGRFDIFVDNTDDYVVVVEIKSTDWDKIKIANITKNLGSHRRQVWRYIDEYLAGDKFNVCAGVIYPKEPVTPGLKERVELYLNDYGLQVVWYDD